jgi:hypothetical protein
MAPTEAFAGPPLIVTSSNVPTLNGSVPFPPPL